MIIKNGAVELEQVGRPGSIGDSCAETSRWDNLLFKLGFSSPFLLDQFICEDGLLRHPDLKNYYDANGESWGVDDFTSDQGAPLYLAARNRPHTLHLAREVKSVIHKKSWWGRTGNGDLVNPKFHAILNDRQWLLNLGVRGQAIAFNLPFRWSDRLNKFEPMKDSYADYLNYFHFGLEADRDVRRMISKETMLEKIMAYYEPEPNSKQLTDLYHTALLTLW